MASFGESSLRPFLRTAVPRLAPAGAFILARNADLTTHRPTIPLQAVPAPLARQPGGRGAWSRCGRIP